MLAYHSVGPGGRLGPELFSAHLRATVRSGLPSLSPSELDSATRGCLLTFDDGFADLWTHGLPLLREHGVRAVVFAIPSRTGEGPARPVGSSGSWVSESGVHGAAAASGAAHPGFLRWSELAALEASGLVTVQSHSFSHAMGWVGDEIIGFHLGTHGKRHWSLAQCTGGDERLGIPRYRRGSALAHRLYHDDPALRDHLAGWLAARGGESYIAERGAAAVSGELSDQARGFRAARPEGGQWEGEEQRIARTLEELQWARQELEKRLGGTRDELCLPWGEYDGVTLDCARRAGIRRVYTLDRGPNPAGRIGFLVNRFEPRARGPLWLRLRLWLYRSTARARLYARVSRRRPRRSGRPRGRA
ncbi:MAG: polysaccharide deacetylase family protein [Deferrisomatales bacterium]|nr:polysaccharide deacetylase family protein [Deferrisomatales bacterium]